MFCSWTTISSCNTAIHIPMPSAPSSRGHPDVEIILLVRPEAIRNAVDAIKSGAADYLAYPVSEAETQVVLERLDKHQILTTRLDYLKDQFWNEEALHVVKTNSNAMRDALFQGTTDGGDQDHRPSHRRNRDRKKPHRETDSLPQHAEKKRL